MPRRFVSAIPDNPRILALGDVSNLARQIKADMDTLTGYVLTPADIPISSFYVAPYGEDTLNDGSRNSPFASLQAAFDAVRAALEAMEDGDPMRFAIHVAAGDYTGNQAILDLRGRDFEAYVDIVGEGPGKGTVVKLPGVLVHADDSSYETFVTFTGVSITGRTSEAASLVLRSSEGSGNVVYVLDRVSVNGVAGASVSCSVEVDDGGGSGDLNIYATGSDVSVTGAGSNTTAIPGLSLNFGTWVSRGCNYVGRRAAAVAAAADTRFVLIDGSLSVVNGTGAAAGNIACLTGAADAVVSLSLVSATPLANGNVVTQTGDGHITLENVTKVSGTGIVSAPDGTVYLGKLVTASGDAVTVTADTLVYTTRLSQIGAGELSGTNWAGGAPVTLLSALDRLAAVTKTLNTDTAIP